MLQLSTFKARSPEDVDALRCAARIGARCLRAALDAARPGVLTRDLDALVGSLIRDLGAEPLFRGYSQGNHPPYPAVCCVSINDEVVHGVPSDRAVAPGDLVTIDVGVRVNGWCADNARSIVAGLDRIDLLDPRDPLAAAVRRRLRLVEHTRAVLDLCVRSMRPGVPWSRIARAAERHARRHELGIVTEFVGHAIGRELHEPPKAPCFVTGYTGPDFVLRPGMTIAVEPILTLDPPNAWLPGNPPGPANRARIRADGNAWNIRTASGADACHEERTVLITDSGSEVLTEESPASGP